MKLEEREGGIELGHQCKPQTHVVSQGVVHVLLEWGLDDMFAVGSSTVFGL